MHVYMVVIFGRIFYNACSYQQGSKELRRYVIKYSYQ